MENEIYFECKTDFSKLNSKLAGLRKDFDIRLSS
jgi:hypothetical protein